MKQLLIPEHPPSVETGDAIGSSMDEMWQWKAALDEHFLVSITDLQGRITHVNDKFCEITGYRREEWIGRDHCLISSGYHSKEFFRDLWRTIADGGVWRGEIQNRSRDGMCFWVAMTIFPILNETTTPKEYLAVSLDITENKKMRAELQIRQHLQLLLADLSSQFVALPNEQVDAAIVRTQQQIVEFMELDRATLWQVEEGRAGLVLTHCWQRPELSVTPAHFQPEKNLPWASQKIRRGESFHFTGLSDLPPEATRDRELFRQHGSQSVICIPLLATGRSFGAIIFTSVRTERVWLPDEITELKLVAQIIANVIGRRRAEERADQLRVEIAHSARTSMLGELAAALAHELNQPLTAILSNAQAGRRFISGGTVDPEELGTILDDIIRDGRRAGGVVHNLRTMLSNASAPRESCCLNEIIGEVTEFLHSELVGQDIELRQVLHPSLPRVHATRVEVQQILVNLIVNAVQAMKDVPHQQRRIDLCTQSKNSNSKVTVTVRDHGCGVPSQQLAVIFQPFFTTKAGGLGMGLAICRRMIEAHGGSIRARNHGQGGAEFVFSLPVESATADQSAGQIGALP